MPEMIDVPIDPLSQTPFPLTLNSYISYNASNASWHHHFFHRTDQRLLTPGGLAARESYVQLVPLTDHNHTKRGRPTFHDVALGSGDWLPQNDDDAFDRIIPSIAGYVSEYGFNLNNPGDYVQPLTRAQRAILERPAKVSPRYHRRLIRHEMRIKAVEDYETLEAPDMTLEEYVQGRLAHDGLRQAVFGRHHFSYHYPLVRNFFRDYVLGQPLGHVAQEVETFASTTDKEHKLHIGRSLLTEATRVATDRVTERYTQMHAQGRLHPAMPSGVAELVLDKLGNPQQRDQLILRRGHMFAAQLALLAEPVPAA